MILGDSLCLPRKHPEVVSPAETWPTLLKTRTRSNIERVGIGGGTIVDLADQAHYYSSLNPGIIIVQAGIVDCAPRALGKIEKDIIASNRYLSFAFHKIFPYRFIRKYRNISYTKPKQFSASIIRIFKEFNDKKIVFIGIMPSTKQYESAVPGITHKINQYNQLLNVAVNGNNGIFIATNDFNTAGLMTDFHHLNKLGHQWVADEVYKRIAQHIKQ